MDLHHLKLFHVVAKNLSFSKTAEELHISQPAISMQIKSFENEIGFKLIDRYGRNVFLTKEGNIIYNYTQKIFELIDEMETEINLLKGRMFGKVNIGASNTLGVYIMPQIIGTFKSKYPDVTVRLHIGNTQEIHDKLIQDELDFAVMGGDVEFNKSFEVEKLTEDVMVIIASPSNPLASFGHIDRSMLSNQQYIGHDENSLLYKAMEKIIASLKLPFNIAMTLGSVDAIKYAVAANLGISFVPYTCAYRDLDMGFLKRINVENMIWKYPYSLIYSNKKNFTTPTLVMMDMIRNQIKKIVAI